jgi:hypothetical protein
MYPDVSKKRTASTFRVTESDTWQTLLVLARRLACLLASLLAHSFGLHLDPEYVRNSQGSGSRNSAVGIATGYGLDDGWVGVWVQVGTLHVVQTSSEAQPASYSIGTGAYFPGSKAAGAWSWPFTSN